MALTTTWPDSGLEPRATKHVDGRLNEPFERQSPTNRNGSPKLLVTSALSRISAAIASSSLCPRLCPPRSKLAPFDPI